jgi:DNA-directed RNA polymerase subunit RPC12/RpoP
MCSVARCGDWGNSSLAKDRPLADHPLKETAEIEIACQHCGYRLMRTVAQLRSKASIDCPACGASIAPDANRQNEKQS